LSSFKTSVFSLLRKTGVIAMLVGLTMLVLIPANASSTSWYNLRNRGWTWFRRELKSLSSVVERYSLFNYCT